MTADLLQLRQALKKAQSSTQKFQNEQQKSPASLNELSSSLFALKQLNEKLNKRK